jgi:hypothetical protein
MEAIKYASASNKEDDSSRVHASFEIPDDLRISDGISTAWAIRVGLGLAMGLSRREAEYFAQVKRGRPARGSADA